MILNVKGGHGTGKSTIFKTLLDKYDGEDLPSFDSSKKGNHCFSIPGIKKPFFVIGSYGTACGGCDAIQPYGLIWERIKKFAEEGHVLFEGAIVSSSYGNIGRETEVFGDESLFGFMDTPLNECLDRIRKRRAEKGNDKPLNPKNTVKKWCQVRRNCLNQHKANDRLWFWIDHTNAFNQLETLLTYAENPTKIKQFISDFSTVQSRPTF